MYICHSSYKLGEDLLNSRDRKSSMVEEIVVELVTFGQIELAMRHFAGTVVCVPGQYSSASQT
jgi:hypothetical protein